MSVNISDKPEMNVVNVGDELSVDEIAGINNSAYPSAVNPFITVSAGDSAYLEKDGGGTVIGTIIVDTDGTVGGNTATITGTSVEVSNYGVGSISIDPILGITFADNTSQATAAVTPDLTPYAPKNNPTFTGTVTIPAGASISGYQTTLSSATTSTEGKVQLATSAETLTGTNTTKSVTPSALTNAVARQFARRYFQTPIGLLATQTTGAGAGYAQVPQYTNISYPTAGISGLARGYSICVQPHNFNSGDWSKPFGFGAFTRFNNNAVYSGTTVRCGIGYTSSPSAGVAIGDLTVRGFGFYWAQGGNVFLQVHDGTTLRSIDTGYTPTSTLGLSTIVYLEAYSDGLGNATAFVRAYNGYNVTGSSYTDYTCSSSNAPTGALMTSPNNGYIFQVTSGTTHTSVQNHGGMHPTFFYE